MCSYIASMQDGASPNEAVRPLLKGRNKMAGSPKYKVYSAAGRYVAAVVDASAAAVLLAIEYRGGSVRLGHGKTLYHDDGAAALSYDAVAIAIMKAEDAVHVAAYDKVNGAGAAAAYRAK